MSSSFMVPKCEIFNRLDFYTIVSLGGRLWGKNNFFVIFSASFGAANFPKLVLSLILRMIFVVFGQKIFFGFRPFVSAVNSDFKNFRCFRYIL